MTDRYEIAPHYDLWMQGARFGELVKVTKSGSVAKFCERFRGRWSLGPPKPRQMTALTIISNGHRRPLLHMSDLSNAEQVNFDYIALGEGEYPRFFRYCGATYDCEEFMCASSADLAGWDGYSSDTFCSGVLIRFVTDSDNTEIVCGRYYS
jgi:hypothetical protein